MIGGDLIIYECSLLLYESKERIFMRFEMLNAFLLVISLVVATGVVSGCANKWTECSQGNAGMRECETQSNFVNNKKCTWHTLGSDEKGTCIDPGQAN